MKNRKILLALPIIVSLSIVAGVFIGEKMASASYMRIFNGSNSSSNHKLNQVLNFIKSDYVDSIQENKIIEETKDVAKVESKPKFEGRQMVMIIQPL